MKRIMVGYDGSEGGRDALALARGLARVEAAEFQVACVWVQDTLLGDVVANEKERSAWFSSRFEEVELELGERAFRRFQPTHASAPAALNQLAEIEEADLIVLGSTHRGSLGRVIPGSVCERLLHRAPCAVGIAPRGYAQSEHVGLGIVGVGYDGRDESKHALGFAQEIAAGIGAQLRLITVVADGVVASEWATEAGQVFRHGDPATVLAQEGVELDLLVVGSRALGPVRGALLGEVSHEVMRTAPCPVIVVPRSSPSGTSSQPATTIAR